MSEFNFYRIILWILWSVVRSLDFFFLKNPKISAILEKIVFFFSKFFTCILVIKNYFSEKDLDSIIINSNYKIKNQITNCSFTEWYKIIFILTSFYSSYLLLQVFIHELVMKDEIFRDLNKAAYVSVSLNYNNKTSKYHMLRCDQWTCTG